MRYFVKMLLLSDKVGSEWERGGSIGKCEIRICQISRFFNSVRQMNEQTNQYTMNERKKKPTNQRDHRERTNE